MPTGYTADLYEGKAITFKEFALTAARGMGAAIMQRDDGPGPIADEYEPSDYHQIAHAKAVDTLAELTQLPLDEWERREAAARADNAAAEMAGAAKTEALRARYEAMLARVEGWQPPTSEHERFKDFMREQLEGSIKFDCSDRSDAAPSTRTAEVYRDERIASAVWNVAYHVKSWTEEQERTASRNKWVRDLKVSLPTN
ncbi:MULTISPECIES: hypothetical protein [unclassified Cryobacterium]|uniref:hypothetical protein n=1 Tax=unclassified Cryobacterium TaxID=2649013 RepID=UPI002AB4869E|nr:MULTISPECIES: hypothetical protein [unclassified Cryobacterium]MDY7542651.1 hypothetical protein [Cryobacterium sp. 5B3]MEB0264772.1 hypothetical protein [Cryobacterium sp. 10I5]MEB0273744.1 hypothetical protein [Cryobacterium sp. 5B3]